MSRLSMYHSSWECQMSIGINTRIEYPCGLLNLSAYMYSFDILNLSGTYSIWTSSFEYFFILKMSSSYLQCSRWLIHKSGA